MADEAQSDDALQSPAPQGKPREYVVVARRYRPQSFVELLGQDQVATALGNAINTSRVGHAYLFTGARGVGKTSAARIFAKALNCVTGPSPAPCNECDICQSITSGEDVDVLEIDGASNRGIDEIRQLRSNVNIRPSRSRFKIYIIDEVHMLTMPAFNALLKTLEEPPEHVKFIFCTTDPEKIPITVLSRCQRFDFAGIRPESISQRLKQICETEQVEVTDEALHLLARRAAGSMRDSQSLLEQLLAFGGEKIDADSVHHLLGTAPGGRLSLIVERLIQRDAAGALAQLDTGLGEGVEAGQLIEQLLGHYRDLMTVCVGAAAELLLHCSPADHEALRQAAGQLGLETILAAVQILDQTLVRMRQSTHTRVLAEMALVRIARLEDLEDLSNLIARLDAGGPSAPAGPPPAGEHRQKPAGSGATPSAPPRGGPRTQENLPPATSKTPSVATASSEFTQSENRTPPPQVENDTSEYGNPPDAVAPAPVATRVDDRHDATVPIAPTGNPPSVSPQTASAELAFASVPKVPSDVDMTEPSSASSSEEMSTSQHDLRPMTEQTVTSIWHEALEEIGTVTEAYGKQADSLAISAPNRLVVSFPAQYTSGKEHCERAEIQRKLEETLVRVTGHPVRLEFRILPGKAPSAPQEPVVNRQQQMREIGAHPMVQRATELFGLELTRVSEPRRAAQSGPAPDSSDGS